VLVLEHVDWRRAVAELCRLAARVFVIIQENPPQLVPRPLSGTLAVQTSDHMHFIAPPHLQSEFERLHFVLRRTAAHTVLDGKRMLAYDFERA
jgi:hypothetical protein